MLLFFFKFVAREPLPASSFFPNAPPNLQSMARQIEQVTFFARNKTKRELYLFQLENK